MKMEKWLVIKVLMICLLQQSMAYSPINRQIVCEDRASTISCPVGRVIKIQRASYGRTSAYLCPHEEIRTTKCSSGYSYDKVSSSCNGGKSCKLVASNEIFGDPCGGTYKYLDVRYTCVKSVTIKKIICEDSASTISCPVDTVIKIQSANYGRTSRSVCPHTVIRTTKCHSYALAILTHLKVSISCNGSKSCRLVASNKVYGDPCGGTHKYLDVRYICV